MKIDRSVILGAIAALALLATAPSASAQDASSKWAPSKDMRVVLSSGPGSAFDVLARAASKLWKKYYGVDLIVQNLPGAGGTLSIDRVMKSPKDGHTIGFMSSSPYLDQLIQSTFPWDVRDIPVFLGIDTPPVGVLTGAKTGFKTWQDVRNAKRRIVIVRWGKLSLDVSIIKDLVAHGVDVSTASFGSFAPIMSAIQSGDGDLWSSVTSITAMEHVREGTMRPLFVYSNERVPYLPDVPTHLELGFPENWINVVVMRLWYAPIGTPDNVTASLGARLANLFKDPEIAPWAHKNGLIYKVITGDKAKQKQLGLHKILTDNLEIYKKYGG